MGLALRQVAYFTQAGPVFHRKAGQCFTHAGPMLA